MSPEDKRDEGQRAIFSASVAIRRISEAGFLTSEELETINEILDAAEERSIESEN